MSVNQRVLDVTTLTAAGIGPQGLPDDREAARACMDFARELGPGYEARALEMSKAPGPDPRYVL